MIISHAITIIFPFLIREFINWFEEDDPDKNKAIILLIITFFVFFFKALFHQ